VRTSCLTEETPSPLDSSRPQPHPSRFKLPRLRLLLAVFLTVIIVFSVVIVFQFIPFTNAAIAVVQGNARGTVAQSTTVFTVTQAANATSGNMNVLTFSSFCSDSSGSNVVISKVNQTGVTWYREKTNTVQWTGAQAYSLDSEIWGGVVGSNAAKEIYVTIGGWGDQTSQTAVANVVEYSGLSASGFLDKSAVNQSSTAKATADSGTTAATTQASELFISSISTYQYGAGTSSNFTLYDGAVYTLVANWFLSYIASGTGSADAWVTPSASARFAGCIVTLKAVVFSASITVGTSTHSWTVNTGDNNVSINENAVSGTNGYISLTVTVSGANFDIGAKASGDLTYGPYSIALTNTNMTGSTWPNAIALTTSYQTIPGLSNVAPGTSLTEKVYLWLSCPTNKPAGAYTETITFEVIQNGGSY
jgi:hypothetical protein